MNLLPACVLMFSTVMSEPQQTASGEYFSGNELIAAHRTLPLGTWVFVTSARGYTISVKITDRGPFAKRKGEPFREFDIGGKAAKLLHFNGKGWLCIQVIN